MRKNITCLVLFVFILTISLIPGKRVDAKTHKSIPDGGYIIDFKKAKISDGKLVIKGTVKNWERATNTGEYKKSGKFKLKLTKKCELIDGYKPTHNISKKKFNKLCKKKDSSHRTIAFMVENKKVRLIRFW